MITIAKVTLMPLRTRLRWLDGSMVHFNAEANYRSWDLSLYTSRSEAWLELSFLFMAFYQCILSFKVLAE